MLHVYFLLPVMPTCVLCIQFPRKSSQEIELSEAIVYLKLQYWYIILRYYGHSIYGRIRLDSY